MQQKEEISPHSCSAVHSQMWAEGLGLVSMSLPVLKEQGGKTDEDMPATDKAHGTNTEIMNCKASVQTHSH